jgi:hypothetical protein
MDAEERRIPLVTALAEQYPFSRGGVRQGRYYAIFATHEPDHARLLTPGQIEYVVWTLAAIPEKDLTFNQELALEKYARGLERARQGDLAFSKGWVNPGVFYEIDKDNNSHARPVTWLPEGRPSYLKGKSLRGLLGKRFPYLDDVYKNGAILTIDRFNGDAGISQTSTRASFDGDEAFEIIPGGDHLIGAIKFDKPAPVGAQHVQGHSSSRIDAPKAVPAPTRPGTTPSKTKPKRKTFSGQPQMY